MTWIKKAVEKNISEGEKKIQKEIETNMESKKLEKLILNELQDSINVYIKEGGMIGEDFEETGFSTKQFNDFMESHSFKVVIERK